jgi:hypothetical protein
MTVCSAIKAAAFIVLISMNVPAHAQGNFRMIPPPPPGTEPDLLVPVERYVTFGAPTAPPKAGQDCPQITLTARTLQKQPPKHGNGIFLTVKNRGKEPVKLRLETYFFEKDRDSQLRLVGVAGSFGTVEPKKALNVSSTTDTIGRPDEWYTRALWGTVRVASCGSSPALEALCEDDAELAKIYAAFKR